MIAIRAVKIAAIAAGIAGAALLGWWSEQPRSGRNTRLRPEDQGKPFVAPAPPTVTAKPPSKIGEATPKPLTVTTPPSTPRVITSADARATHLIPREARRRPTPS